MDPREQSCPNPSCAARGQADRGNTRAHSRKERRFRCTTRGKTFAATTGTPFYRLHKEARLFVTALTLLAHGCPLQTIVAAFGLDERTVAAWQDKAGRHCRGVHRHLLRTSPRDLRHAQADEIHGKTVGGHGWLAMALAVPSRLWLGGVVGPVRNLALTQRLVGLVRRAALPGRVLLVCVDGLASYVTASWRASREKVYTGRRGRPPYRLPPGLLLGQVIKRHSGRRLVEVVRRAVWGSAARIRGVLRQARAGQQINTSYVERLNATSRSRRATLARRGRGLAHQVGVLHSGLYLVGCAYNLCWGHRSPRRGASGGKAAWQARTPAMAAGWGDHVWSMHELLSFKPFTALHG